jgi:hypothetical protein
MPCYSNGGTCWFCNIRKGTHWAWDWLVCQQCWHDWLD